MCPGHGALKVQFSVLRNANSFEFAHKRAFYGCEANSAFRNLVNVDKTRRAALLENDLSCFVALEFNWIFCFSA